MGLFKKTTRAELPNFWKTYEASFLKKSKPGPEQHQFVVLDTETTGFDFEEDRILCIGALLVQDRTILVNKSFEVYLIQERYNSATAEIHGILKRGKLHKIPEIQALEQLLAYLGNRIIVAHHTQFDITMINRALNRHGLPQLKNQTLDTAHLYKRTLIKSNLLERKTHYTLDELADKFNISKKDRHTAIGDAYITAIAFLKIMSKLKKKKDFSLKALLA